METSHLSSSGQSGCFDGCDTLNASNLLNSSFIREIVGNFDISTLNLQVNGRTFQTLFTIDN